MALVGLEVGGRRYELACRDGEEDHLRRLAAQVDAEVAVAARALGPSSEARQLLLAALLLADRLTETPPVAPVAAPAEERLDGLAEALDQLAARLEMLADGVEEVPGDH